MKELIKEIIESHIGNIGNRPETRERIEALTNEIYETISMDYIIKLCNKHIGNPHKRKDLDEVFIKIAKELQPIVTL